MPQALLFLILMVMLTMLFLNILLFTLAPQYVMYGSQHYVVSCPIQYVLFLMNCCDTQASLNAFFWTSSHLRCISETQWVIQ